MLRVLAFLGGFVALVSAGDLVETRDLIQEEPLPLNKNQMDPLADFGAADAAAPAASAAVTLDEQAAPKMKEQKKEKKVVTTLTLFPSPTPNFLAALLAGVLWLSIFCTGFCALFGLETPQKFVEKGLVMSKEY